MNIVFCFPSCTDLGYFMPLLIEAQSRNHNCFFKITRNSAKYNSPKNPENKKQVDEIAKQYDVGWHSNEKVDVSVSLESIEIKGSLSYSLVSKLDYLSHYPKYIGNADWVLFPSKWFADYPKIALSKQKFSWNEGSQRCIDCGIIDNPKNLYLGSPKYDVVSSFSRESICNKYKLDSSKKYCLILAPRPEDKGRTDLTKTCERCYNNDWIPILKSRRKHPFSSDELKKFKCFYDETWFPPTSLELMYISEEVILTDSVGVKEAVMLNKPVTNIDSKRYRTLEELYEPNAKEKYLWNFKSSPIILDHMESHV